MEAPRYLRQYSAATQGVIQEITARALGRELQQVPGPDGLPLWPFSRPGLAEGAPVTARNAAALMIATGLGEVKGVGRLVEQQIGLRTAPMPLFLSGQGVPESLLGGLRDLSAGAGDLSMLDFLAELLTWMSANLDALKEWKDGGISVSMEAFGGQMRVTVSKFFQDGISSGSQAIAFFAPPGLRLRSGNDAGLEKEVRFPFPLLLKIAGLLAQPPVRKRKGPPKNSSGLPVPRNTRRPTGKANAPRNAKATKVLAEAGTEMRLDPTDYPNALEGLRDRSRHDRVRATANKAIFLPIRPKGSPNVCQFQLV